MKSKRIGKNLINVGKATINHPYLVWWFIPSIYCKCGDGLLLLYKHYTIFGRVMGAEHPFASYFGVHQSSRVLTRTQAKNQIMGVQLAQVFCWIGRTWTTNNDWFWGWHFGEHGCAGLAAPMISLSNKGRSIQELCFRIAYVHYDHWPLHMDISEVSQIISHPQLGFIVGFTTLSWFWLGAQDCSGMFSMTLGAGTASVIPYNWPLGTEELWWF